MQRNPVLYVSVDISANVCSCDRRSLDNQLCIRVIPDLANSASRVALSVSSERDSHPAPPLECVISLSVPQLVPPPQEYHRQDQNCQLSVHLDNGCFPRQTMMAVPSTPSPLPACSGAPELAGTTTTSQSSTACLVTVGASPAAASAGRPATSVLLMATTRFESSRSDAGRRRIVRATTMPTLVPMR